MQTERPRPRPRVLPRLLLVLAALLALGQFQGASAGPQTSHELVAAPVLAPAIVAARLARHVPSPTPWSQLHVVGWATGALVLVLLPSLAVAAWSPTRRARQAFLLPFAGRGPPTSS
jgi:hypothetical protein